VAVNLAAQLHEAESQSRDPSRPSAPQSEISDLRSQIPTPAQGSLANVLLPEGKSGGTPPDSVRTAETSALQSRLHALERLPAEGRGKAAQFVPIRFIYRNKLTQDDRLLLAFDGFVLAEALGREVSLGKLIHGDDHATLKVKTSAQAGEVRKHLENITALPSSPARPDLVLNRHCAECEFRDRCRKKAIEADDLSLLAGMSAKERQKLRSKGIFTVTQLSYTFRPRRRPRRLRDKREKYHHALKALAIREKKIHIVGSRVPTADHLLSRLAGQCPQPVANGARPPLDSSHRQLMALLSTGGLSLFSSLAGL
jgi:predicted RecB family nuclease